MHCEAASVPWPLCREKNGQENQPCAHTVGRSGPRSQRTVLAITPAAGIPSSSSASARAAVEIPFRVAAVARRLEPSRPATRRCPVVASEADSTSPRRAAESAPRWRSLSHQTLTKSAKGDRSRERRMTLCLRHSLPFLGNLPCLLPRTRPWLPRASRSRCPGQAGRTGSPRQSLRRPRSRPCPLHQTRRAERIRRARQSRLSGRQSRRARQSRPVRTAAGWRPRPGASSGRARRGRP